MNDGRFTNVFHPSDFTRGDSGAFMHSLRIALDSNAELTVLHSGPHASEIHSNDFPKVRPILEQWGVIPLGASREAVVRSGVKIHKIKRKGENPVKAILQQIEHDDPDLVVMATHQRRGVSRWIHQAIAEPISRESHIKTLFVPRKVSGFVSERTGTIRLKNIVIPIDRDPDPQCAVDAALQLARILKAPDTHFRLIHVGDDSGLRQLEVPLESGWSMKQHSCRGSVVERILKQCESLAADLIVMATQGHKGFLDALRGSTTERVLHETQCPLLAVPAQ